MTKEQAIEQLEQSIDGWYEFWDGASHHISEKDIEAMQILIELAKNSKQYMKQEEAIERIKARFDKWALDDEDMKAIQTLIPELSEDEDERVRKALINLVSTVGEYYLPKLEDRNKMLAYLEKQEIFSKNGEGCYYYHADGSYTFIGSMGFGPIEDIKINGERPKTENKSVDLIGVCPCVEKQKESLHIQETYKENADSFKDEDERIRMALCDIVRDMPYMETELRAHGLTVEQALAYLENQKEEEGYEAIPVESTLEYKLGFKAGKESEKQKEQKPVSISCGHENDAEWSEADEKTINDACCWIAEYAGYLMDKNWGKASMLMGLTEKLKSLRPQPKQERQIKEGDKVSIHCRKDREKDIIAIYDGKVGKVTDIWDKRYPWGHIAVKLDDGCNNSFHEDELEVLDESHWKPNEEQMEALNKAIPVCMGVVGRDAVVPLESLCEELEKLM